MIMHMNGFFAAHSDLDVDAPLYRIMPKKHLEQLLAIPIPHSISHNLMRNKSISSIYSP